MALSRDVLAQRIKQALRCAGLSQQDLAAAVDMDPTALSKALAGRRAFKSLEVALIAERLGVPTDTLLADDGADQPPRMALAARVAHQVAPAIEAALGRVEQIQELDSLLGELGRPADAGPPFPPLSPVPDPVRQGEVMADAVRRRVGVADDGDLPAEPEDFAGWLEDRLGLDVCLAPLPVGLDGLAVSRGELRLVLCSSGVAATRQRFTLAHEVCHLAVGDAQELTVDEDVFARHTAEEQRANAFAAALLMPAGAIRVATDGRRMDEPLVVELLGRFRVSLDALAFRLHNLGVVNAAGRDRVRAMSSTRIALRPGRVDELQARNERRAPGRLLARATEAFALGELGIRPLATLLDTEPERLLAELSPPRFATQDGGADETVYEL